MPIANTLQIELLILQKYQESMRNWVSCGIAEIERFINFFISQEFGFILFDFGRKLQQEFGTGYFTATKIIQ